MISKLRSVIGRRLQQLVSNAVVQALRESLDARDLRQRLDLAAFDHWSRKREQSRNPLVRAGRKFYSQNDEDGIVLEILGRLRKNVGIFLEIGVENGTECNTLILLLSGWRGVWLGNEDLAATVLGDRLIYKRGWVTRENVAAVSGDALARLSSTQFSPDLISIDVDGIDYYLAKSLLEAGFTPSLFIVEYNAKLPPPILFVQPYVDDHRWDGSDYFGASLASFVELFSQYGYFLVACNVTGANAFFVSESSGEAFQDVPRDTASLFMEADYNWFVTVGHPPSGKMLSYASGLFDVNRTIGSTAVLSERSRDVPAD